MPAFPQIPEVKRSFQINQSQHQKNIIIIFTTNITMIIIITITIIIAIITCSSPGMVVCALILTAHPKSPSFKVLSSSVKKMFAP